MISRKGGTRGHVEIWDGHTFQVWRARTKKELHEMGCTARQFSRAGAEVTVVDYDEGAEERWNRSESKTTAR